MNHSEIQDLLGAFALDAVDEDEALEIETHLITCEVCRREVHDHRDVVTRLAGAGIAAPNHVWDSIASHLDTDSLPPRPSPAPPLQISPLVPRRYSRTLRIALAVAAAAIVVALGSGLQALRLQHEVDHLNALSSTTAITDALQRALLDPSTQRVTLTAAVHTNPLADVVLQPSGQAFIVNRALRPLGANSTYQLWGIANGRAISLGLLGRAPGTIAVAVTAGTTVRTFAITVEPSGGVVVPDHQPVATGTV
ncbi:MAG: anti-sigma factor [Acidimicrobiaceae bacterium]|nr:anti-sigma factor [Acidimicrobiaceae bacterium]